MAEWQRHEATWLAWPCGDDLWGPDLAAARVAVRELARVIARGETVHMLCPADEQHALRDLDGVVLHDLAYGDIWLRDTGPVFATADDRVEALCFGWNGWGGKYHFPPDDHVAAGIAELAGVARHSFDFVLEGGAIEFDGEGTLLTTRQCLLNPNRNPGLDQEAIELRLRDAFGIDRIHWLGDGLRNDHTDGHVDTIARFVRPGVAVCMAPDGPDDPNREALELIARDLAWFADAHGRRLEVVTIPSPGTVLDARGELMPASYANYYVANAVVAVPTYGVANDAAAVDALQALFPTREVVGIDARAILTGGGALHCITKEQPVAEARRE